MNTPELGTWFIFYERWGEPNNGFLPNFSDGETKGLATSKEMLVWLEGNAEKVRSTGKWHLFRMGKLPPYAPDVK